MRYVIIGSGIAGVTAARTVRQHDPVAEITVYTSEVHPLGLYARKDLARQLARGVGQPEDMLIAGERDLAKQGIEVLYEEVLRVFPDLKQVLKPRHLRQTYDRLLIASGATPRIIDAPGLHYIGVHQARNFEDFSLMEAWIPELKQRGAVVIGGGILGLDMAYALMQRGVLTTLVVRDNRLTVPGMSAEEATLAAERLAETGVHILYGQTLTAYLSDDERVLDAVQLSNGHMIPARMALCTIGVHPTTNFLEESDIQIDGDSGCIPVTSTMQTNLPVIYAAGNCASVSGFTARNWEQSAEQGRIAALNMLGQPAHYTPPTEERVMPLILEGILQPG